MNEGLKYRKTPKARRGNGGFTVIEVMAAIVVLVLITVALGVGIPATLNAYASVKTTGEASSLLATLSDSISDELRYATDVSTNSLDEVQSYSSAVYGANARLSGSSGRILVGYTSGTAEYPLLPDYTYTPALWADISTVEYSGGVFSLTVAVYGPNPDSPLNSIELASIDLTVRALNP